MLKKSDMPNHFGNVLGLYSGERFEYNIGWNQPKVYSEWSRFS